MTGVACAVEHAEPERVDCFPGKSAAEQLDAERAPATSGTSPENAVFEPHLFQRRAANRAGKRRPSLESNFEMATRRRFS